MNNLIRISNNWKHDQLLKGFISGIALIYIANFLPLTYISTPFSVLNAGAGPRLTINGTRIHHYLIGLAIIATSVTVKPFPEKFKWFFMGLGLALVIDELPELSRNNFIN